MLRLYNASGRRSSLRYGGRALNLPQVRKLREVGDRGAIHVWANHDLPIPGENHGQVTHTYWGENY